MNIVRKKLILLDLGQCLKLGLSHCPHMSVRRGLRGRPPKPRYKELEKPPIPVSSAFDKALETPLTEEDLSVLSVNVPELDNVTKNLTDKKQGSLQENFFPKLSVPQLGPKLNMPLSEPVTIEDQFERLAQVITPLGKVPYKEQLKMKHKKVHEVLTVLGKQLKKFNDQVKLRNKGIACPVEPIRPSPDVVAYRNKDEFGIHNGVDGNPKTVGFFVGRGKDPLVTCVPATHLINMKDAHKHIAQKFQTFIRQSPYEACQKFDGGGIWRDLSVRSTTLGEKMATVIIHPQDLTDEEISEIMDNLQNFFFHGEGAECELDSLYLQTCKYNRCNREAAPYRHIRGKEHIIETCEGLSFCLSPDSFFQINTRGAEVLYRTVREMVKVSPLTTLLDISSGPVSLVMAPYVRGTIGIEVNPAAVEDARKNAVINNISNTQFIAGSVGRVLPEIIPDLNSSSDVVAIVNPGRSGLWPSVVNAIRQCETITKLLYISFRPEGDAMGNFIQLAATKGKAKWNVDTPPFIPKYAVPVDMFPHTPHTELAILFERQRTLMYDTCVFKNV